MLKEIFIILRQTKSFQFMKIVKYVFLLLVLAVIAVTVFIATQEGKYDIKKERVIKVPKAVLYNYINEYKNWENVGILTGNDTTAVFTYSAATSGPGAAMSWKQDDTNGEVKTVRTAENDSIIQNAVIDGLDSDIKWAFKDSINSTKVTVSFKGELSFSEKANALLKGGVNDKMESVLDKALDNLDNFLVKELAVYTIEVKGRITKTAAFYLGHSVTSKISEINKNAAETFPKLLKFIKDNKIVKNGSPFILYKNINKAEENASYMVCIPIKEEIRTMTGSEYEGGKLTEFQAVKTTLKGDYSHLREAWDKSQKYLVEKGIQENTTGQYVEMYTKGVQKTKRPSEWVTDIYIPVGQPTILPLVDNSILLTGTTPATPKPATPTIPVTRPAATVNKPAATTTGTTRPPTASPSVNKPAAIKPASTTNTTGTTAKPAATTRPKPAAAKPASGTTTPKPATTPAQN